MNKTYPIHETFLSFQGEGCHAGLPAFFIRTYRCPVHCPWCDSAGTWHPKWVPPGVERLTPEQLAYLVEESPAAFVVVTGGEPTIFDLRPLMTALKMAFVHLETSGGFPILGNFEWITLSPKRWKPPLTESVRLANEFKIIVDHPSDIKGDMRLLLDAGLRSTDPRSIWLHPEWSHREDQCVLDHICAAVTRREYNFRAGLQIHKYYRADLRDPRSRPAVPLGGDANKGY